jgi:hypothetical protein
VRRTFGSSPPFGLDRCGRSRSCPPPKGGRGRAEVALSLRVTRENSPGGRWRAEELTAPPLYASILPHSVETAQGSRSTHSCRSLQIERYRDWWIYPLRRHAVTTNLGPPAYCTDAGATTARSRRHPERFKQSSAFGVPSEVRLRQFLPGVVFLTPSPLEVPETEVA